MHRYNDGQVSSLMDSFAQESYDLPRYSADYFELLLLPLAVVVVGNGGVEIPSNP